MRPEAMRSEAADWRASGVMSAGQDASWARVAGPGPIDAPAAGPMSGVDGGVRAGSGGLPAAVAAKIVTIEELARRREALRARGQRLVQCHGCFDIVHPGHIRHLRQARALGDVLLVSITGDAAMRKGTGRPLIPQELRAENLAALDCVDLVCVEERETALELLRIVRPDVYVKGQEYERNGDARFLAERRAVEEAGGRVVFSSGDVVFSSTALIAALEQSADPYHQRLTQLARHPELSGARVEGLIGRFRGKRVVVVGECIRDVYVLCDRPEVAGESPVLTLRPMETREYAGGAAIAALHAAAMGARPTLVTMLPEDEEGRAMRARLEGMGVEVRSMRGGGAIPQKQRYLVGAQKLMKVDVVEPWVPDAAQRGALAGLAAEAAHGGVDAAIVMDFGLGMMSGAGVADVCRALRPLAGVISGDVSGKRADLLAFGGVDLVCPAESELRDAVRMPSEGLPAATWKLLDQTGIAAAIVTLGSEGLVAFSRTPEAGEGWVSRLHGEHIPAMSRVAIDALGCGDTLLTAATLTLACGGSLLAAGYVGSLAASVQVQRLGNVPVGAADLRRTLAAVQSGRLTYDASDAGPVARVGPMAKAS